ncbi:MAG: hypothetical protein Q7T10_10230 [Rhodoferax sp.]|uniref:hypothetical protein n=1 Tax=Rhodoferax sp. TaxID=50421 RepID=UPI00271D5B80|nr:hypothetical protein [Rhodoferax sp.]MDO8449167.1 hypothetical protein [Rhodoferax sp.]
MNLTPYARIVLDAYDIQTTGRAHIAQMHHERAGAHLSTLALSLAPEPRQIQGMALALDSLYYEAWEVSEIAHKLGVGVLIAEYLVRETNGDFDLFRHPLDTAFKRTAVRALATLVKNCTDHRKARAAPEVHTAYQEIGALLPCLGRVVHDSQRASMGLPIG